MGTRRRIVNEPVQQVLRAVQSGLEANMPKGATLHVAGKPFAKHEVLAALQQFIQPYDAVEAARKSYQSRVDVRDEAEPKASAFLRDLGSAVASQFGSAPEVLEKFGVPTPKQRRELSPQELVIKAAKAKKTRELRGTNVKKDLSKIKATGDFKVSVGTSSGDSTAAAPPVKPTAPSSSGASSSNSGAVNVVVPSSNTELASGATNGATSTTQLNGAAH